MTAEESSISVIPLLVVLISAVGAILIACTGQRRANLREFWSVAAAEAGVGLGLVIALNRNKPGAAVADLTQLKW